MLALEHEFALTHGGTVALIVVGNVLYGVAAPFAGWLGDRWSTTGMVGLFFLGTGAGMVATGLARSPFEIAIRLAITGLFASIYHPVGIAWLVRNARSWGKELGINGVFGGLGPAAASLTAGALVDLAGWRAAFIVPGLIVLATGFAFCVLRWRGLIVETRVDRRPPPESGHGDMVRAFLVLSLTMLCSSSIRPLSRRCRSCSRNESTPWCGTACSASRCWWPSSMSCRAACRCSPATWPTASR